MEKLMQSLQMFKFKLTMRYLGFKDAIRRWRQNPSRYIQFEAEMFFDQNMDVAETENRIKQLMDKRNKHVRMHDYCDPSITIEPLTGQNYAYGIRLSLKADVKYRTFKQCAYCMWNLILDFEKEFQIKTSYKNLYAKITTDQVVPDVIKEQPQMAFLISGVIAGTAVKYKHDDYVAYYEGPVNAGNFDRIINILDNVG